MLKKTAGLLLIVGLLLFPALTQANGGGTKRAPGFQTVPLKSETISVVQELLVFDFQHFNENTLYPARVTATYWLESQGGQAEIVNMAFPYIGYFSSPEEALQITDPYYQNSHLAVYLDDAPLNYWVKTISEYTFSIWSGKLENYSGEEIIEPTFANLLALADSTDESTPLHNDLHLIYFDLPVEPGQVHKLEVTFPQGAAWRRGPFRQEHTAVYFLEPASYWKDFGALTIQVHVPDTRKHAIKANLPLTRKRYQGGYMWEGKFPSLPGENLHITLVPKFPRGFTEGSLYLNMVLFGPSILIFAGVIGLTILVIRAFRRTDDSSQEFKPPEPPHTPWKL